MHTRDSRSTTTRARAFHPSLDGLETRHLLTTLGMQSALASRVAPIRAGLTRPQTEPTSFGLTPLTQLKAPYHNLSGGLYGSFRNTPSPELMSRLESSASRIEPLDRTGRPSADGTIGFLSLGPSTTMLASQAIKQAIEADPARNPAVTFVNGGINEMTAQRWAASGEPWNGQSAKLSAARVSPDQVQVLWLKAEMLRPWLSGASTVSRMVDYANLLDRILARAEARFPNLQLVYVSSDEFSGYVKRNTLREPESYESAFGVREFIRRHESDRDGPTVLWGPYLWADGDTPRDDGLTWLPDDFQAKDGVHPTLSGSFKVAEQMMAVLHGPTAASLWYFRSPNEPVL
jgi:hypothetical protein